MAMAMAVGEFTARALHCIAVPHPHPPTVGDPYVLRYLPARIERCNAINCGLKTNSMLCQEPASLSPLGRESSQSRAATELTSVESVEVSLDLPLCHRGHVVFLGILLEFGSSA